MKMFVTERRQAIMELLHDKKRLTVKELATEIGVSEATLRADLNKMEMDGLLTRTHGGAVLREETDNDTSFSVREKKNKEEKTKISERALEQITEKQCILLDASSTALELARLIKNEPMRLTVVTSGVLTALELKDNPNITVIMIGGVVTNGSTSIEGTLGLDILNHVNIDIMFTSGNGFSLESGLTDFNLYEVELKKQLVKKANKLVSIVDSSKIGVNSSSAFATIDEIDILITDKPIPIEFAEKLAQNNVHVITAAE
ncbi:DeoR/GlpR family DNA-binding transcription regulator [Virgibacillus halodenitrificans]|uniref:DeoR/GlpR family DNA-binding transcription regulator n=1 Tax=Virgibacillus halodenitrificans TaxID=1482 RepID=UPI00030117DC|nr:DeoR/GlpR family DNA-binding transcription regulator [Virgibacillus halodenitrificans]